MKRNIVDATVNNKKYHLARKKYQCFQWNLVYIISKF